MRIRASYKNLMSQQITRPRSQTTSAAADKKGLHPIRAQAIVTSCGTEATSNH